MCLRTSHDYPYQHRQTTSPGPHPLSDLLSSHQSHHTYDFVRYQTHQINDFQSLHLSSYSLPTLYSTIKILLIRFSGISYIRKIFFDYCPFSVAKDQTQVVSVCLPKDYGQNEALLSECCAQRPCPWTNFGEAVILVSINGLVLRRNSWFRNVDVRCVRSHSSSF